MAAILGKKRAIAAIESLFLDAIMVSFDSNSLYSDRGKVNRAVRPGGTDMSR